MVKYLFCLSTTLALAFVGTGSVLGTELTILHAFPDGPNDGCGGACDSLKISGSTIYGSTEFGRGNYGGTLFKMQLDGSQYQTIYSFSQTSSPIPYGVTLDGGTIYGTTLDGGAYGYGAVYKIQTDGTEHQVLHSFSWLNGDGAFPYCGVESSGSRLFGAAVVGGLNNNGVIFSMGKDGSDYQILHTFTDGSDGNSPYGSPTVSGSVLYGISSTSIYKMNTDGSNFQVLKSNFGGFCKLTLNGSTLFGTAGNQVFSIGTDGSDFKLLHQLSGRSQCGLSLAGSTLYGMTRWGGIADKGTIFSVNTDGTNYQVLYTFLGGMAGEEPICDPIVVGATLYGRACAGPNGEGFVFSMPVPEPSTLALLGMSAFGLLSWAWRRNRKG